MNTVTVHVSKSHKNAESANLVEAIYFALNTLKKKNAKVYIEKDLGEKDAPYIVDATGRKIVGTFKSLARFIFEGPKQQTPAILAAPEDSLQKFQNSQILASRGRSEPSDDDDADIESRRQQVASESARRSSTLPSDDPIDRKVGGVQTGGDAKTKSLEKLVGTASKQLRGKQGEFDDDAMLKQMLANNAVQDPNALI